MLKEKKKEKQRENNYMILFTTLIFFWRWYQGLDQWPLQCNLCKAGTRLIHKHIYLSKALSLIDSYFLFLGWTVTKHPKQCLSISNNFYLLKCFWGRVTKWRIFPSEPAHPSMALMSRSPWAGFAALVGERRYCKPIPLIVFLSLIGKLLLEQVVFLTCVAMVWQFCLAVWGIYYSTVCPRVQKQRHRSNLRLVPLLSPNLWQGDRDGRAKYGTMVCITHCLPK